MAYSALPTRTTADVNSAADVNQLQENIRTIKTGETGIVYNGSVYLTDVSYVILDDDYYTRIEVDTTAGNITITLPLKANNLGRVVEIANIKGGTNKVIISPNATDANKLSNDGLAAIWLPKIGDFIRFQESANSGFWEVINERISAQLRLNTYAGYGSTDTKIMRFTNVVDNYGNMFSENHVSGYSANVKGLEITINRSGRYNFYFSSRPASSADLYMGLSINSAQLTTAFESITVGNKLTITNPGNLSGNSIVGNGSITAYFAKGDIIRPHTTGGTPQTAAYSLFSCSYLGN